MLHFKGHSFGQIVKKNIIIGSAAKDTNCHANVITKSRIMNCAAREWMDEVSMDLVYQPSSSPHVKCQTLISSRCAAV